MPSVAAAAEASAAQFEETRDAIFLPIASAAARCLDTFGLPQLRCSLIVKLEENDGDKWGLCGVKNGGSGVRLA